MKYDAIVNQGIPIYERVPIPEALIPEDSRVEIDAKIYAGYFTHEKVPTMEELIQVRGRAWYVYYSEPSECGVSLSQRGSVDSPKYM